MYDKIKERRENNMSGINFNPNSQNIQNIQEASRKFADSAKGLSDIEKKTNSVMTKALEFFKQCYRMVEYYFSSERKNDLSALKELNKEISSREQKHDAEFAAHEEMGTNLDNEVNSRGLLSATWNLFSDGRKKAALNKISDELNTENDNINKLKDTAIKLNNYINARSWGGKVTRPNTEIGG